MKFDKYDILLSRLGYGSGQESLFENDFSEDDILSLAKEIGISLGEYSLKLWNDDINELLFVVHCLFTHVNINLERAMQLALAAHNHGSVYILHGTLDELNAVKLKLHNNNLTCTIIKEGVFKN